MGEVYPLPFFCYINRMGEVYPLPFFCYINRIERRFFMALFKINSGNEENLFVNRENSNELLVPFNPGWAYFSPDTGNFFIDKPIED